LQGYVLSRVPEVSHFVSHSHVLTRVLVLPVQLLKGVAAVGWLTLGQTWIQQAQAGNGRRGIRTPVGVCQQIYSLPSLAT
jgi:hypothetical protein